ncbi:hypothetical protein [Neptuniibacter sp. QD57_21]|uniref:hypothetical protein n=1 Tax=Neptuniibacter sp. QD57_21 TaxID=3398213 RepID=UPI0039F4772A
MKNLILVVGIIGAGMYVYQAQSSQVDPNITVKELLDKVSTETVYPSEVEVAFRNAVINVCEINGKDLANGFGSVEQCKSNFQTKAREACFSKINSFDNKVYTSRAPLKSDFSTFFQCSMRRIDILAED